MKTQNVNPVYAELEKCVREYLEAKQHYDAARIAFEAAREKFAGVRRLAGDALSISEWDSWWANHKNVQFVGMQIGEAIYEVLRERAFQAAKEHVVDRKKLKPEVPLYMIFEALQERSFEFKSATPLREINAALMRRKGIVRVPPLGKAVGNPAYRLEDIEGLLEIWRLAERRRDEAKKQEPESKKEVKK